MISPLELAHSRALDMLVGTAPLDYSTLYSLRNRIDASWVHHLRQAGVADELIYRTIVAVNNDPKIGA